MANRSYVYLLLFNHYYLGRLYGEGNGKFGHCDGAKNMGGLTQTIANAVELIISIFSLKSGLIGIVFASLTGSLLGTVLLVRRLSFFVGGIKFKRQPFNMHGIMGLY